VNFQLEEYLEHPELSWNLYQISRHRNVTFEMISTHPDIYWDVYAVHCNPNVTKEIVLQHPEFPWDWKFLCEYNPNFTVTDYCERYELRSDTPRTIRFTLCAHPRFLIDDLIAHPGVWDKNDMVHVSFRWDGQEIERKEQQLQRDRWMKLQHEFIFYFYHPSRVHHHSFLLSSEIPNH